MLLATFWDKYTKTNRPYTQKGGIAICLKRLFHYQISMTFQFFGKGAHCVTNSQSWSISSLAILDLSFRSDSASSVSMFISLSWSLKLIWYSPTDTIFRILFSLQPISPHNWEFFYFSMETSWFIVSVRTQLMTKWIYGVKQKTSKKSRELHRNSRASDMNLSLIDTNSIK